MSIPIRAPFLPYDKLRESANNFLDKYHPSRKIPVPIEEIVEFQLKMDIVPMPGLQELLRDDGHGIVGFTTSDLKEIYVDQAVWQTRPGRYRYTLAHEVGHVFLHAKLYELSHYRSISGWKKFVNAIPVNEHHWFEQQAYGFAGLILVPSDKLEKRVKKHMKKIYDEVKKRNISGIKDIEPVWDLVYDYTAEDFEVSKEVVHRRIEYDKLREIYSEKWKTGDF